MTIRLYRNNSEAKTVNKSIEKLSADLVGNFRDNQINIMSPSITLTKAITGDINGANYFEIVELGRFYYLTSLTTERSGITILSGRLDVLYTYQNAILGAAGLIDRAESDKQYNKYLYDDKFRTEVGNWFIPQLLEMEGAGSLEVSAILMTVAGISNTPGP